MEQLSNLALLAQMIESADKNVQSAKQLLRELMGGQTVRTGMQNMSTRTSQFTVSEGGKVVEGIFDGQNMAGPDGKQYPVPANYASKSKLVKGDTLKLTIAEDGSFIYKQIGPVERQKMLGILNVDERGDFIVNAENKMYKVLLASLTYFKAEAGDEVTIIVPKDGDTEWAAVENVMKRRASGEAAEEEMSTPGKKGDVDDEL